MSAITIDITIVQSLPPPPGRSTCPREGSRHGIPHSHLSAPTGRTRYPRWLPSQRPIDHRAGWILDCTRDGPGDLLGAERSDACKHQHHQHHEQRAKRRFAEWKNAFSGEFVEVCILSFSPSVFISKHYSENRAGQRPDSSGASPKRRTLVIGCADTLATVLDPVL